MCEQNLRLRQFKYKFIMGLPKHVYILSPQMYIYITVLTLTNHECDKTAVNGDSKLVAIEQDH